MPRKKKAPAKKRPGTHHRPIDPQKKKAIAYLIALSKEPNLQSVWNPTNLEPIRASMRAFGLREEAIAILTSLDPKKIGKYIGGPVPPRCFIALV